MSARQVMAIVGGIILGFSLGVAVTSPYDTGTARGSWAFAGFGFGVVVAATIRE